MSGGGDGGDGDDRRGALRHTTVLTYEFVKPAELFLRADALQDPIVGDTGGQEGGVLLPEELPVGELVGVGGGEVELEGVGGAFAEEADGVHGAQTGLGGWEG